MADPSNPGGVPKLPEGVTPVRPTPFYVPPVQTGEVAGRGPRLLISGVGMPPGGAASVLIQGFNTRADCEDLPWTNHRSPRDARKPLEASLLRGVTICRFSHAVD